MWKSKKVSLLRDKKEEYSQSKMIKFSKKVIYSVNGNGNPLQCSCLENPRDGGAWWAAIYGVAQSQTPLKRLSSSSSSSSSVNGDIEIRIFDLYFWSIVWVWKHFRYQLDHHIILRWETEKLMEIYFNHSLNVYLASTVFQELDWLFFITTLVLLLRCSVFEQEIYR